MSVDIVNDIEPRVQYTAAAAQTDFDYPFPIFADGDLVVDVDGVTQALTTDYTVSGAGADTGGTVTFLVAMAGNEVVTIYRDLPIERTTDFQQNGRFSSAAFNDELDKIIMVQQQLSAAVRRALRVPQADTTASADMELPSIANRASKYLYFNASGDPEMATAVAANQVFSQSTVGTALYTVQTPTELANGITPSNPYWPPGDIRRYGGTVGGSLNLVLQNAVDSGAWVSLPPDDGYTLSSAVTMPIGACVDATGSTITLSGATTRINMNTNSTWRGGKLVGPGSAYVLDNYAFYCAGTRNGAGVAPTRKTNIRVEGVHVDGFGDTAVYLYNVEYAWVEKCLLENLGYAGVLGLSCNSVEVEGCTIENLIGESASGELNAYGVTFTADTASNDFVRDPHSSYCRAVNNTVVGVPTWHAFDTHGGQYCDFLNNTIIDCKRGVILTNRGFYGAKYCRAEGNTYINTFAQSATNSNATEKRSTAIWDIGASTALQNEFNSIKDNYIYQAGESTTSTAAIITQYTQRGEVSDNTLYGCYNIAIACQDYTEWYTFNGNKVIDVRSIGIAGGSTTDNPMCFRFFIADAAANFNEIVVTNNIFSRLDGALDNFVGEVGFLVDNTASKSAFFSNNTFVDVDTPWSYTGDTTGFTGDVELSFTATLTGMSGATTGTVTYARHGRVVQLTLPAISGTSNTTDMTITGLPTHLIPLTTKTVLTRGVDSGTAVLAIASIAASTGVITYTNGVTGAVWTNSGVKGVPVSTLTYTLD